MQNLLLRKGAWRGPGNPAFPCSSVQLIRMERSCGIQLTSSEPCSFL
jgi:hypothetical protein